MLHTAIASTDLAKIFLQFFFISWSRVWSCLWIESWTWHVSCQVWTFLNPWWLYAQTRFGYLKLFKIWRHDLFKNDLFHTLPFLQTRTNCISALMAWHISLRRTVSFSSWSMMHRAAKFRSIAVDHGPHFFGTFKLDPAVASNIFPLKARMTQIRSRSCYFHLRKFLGNGEKGV